MLLAAVALTAPLAAGSTAQAEDVGQFVQGFTADFENLDWERFRARFSDDSTVFFPPQYGAPLAAGRAETDPAWERVFASIKAASKASAPPYWKLVPHGLQIMEWPGGALVTFTLGGGEAPLNRRTLVLRQKTGAAAGSWEIVHLHGSTIPKSN